MDFIVNRYPSTHPLFSAVPDKEGVLPIFGSFCDAEGNELHKCMERADALIPEGTYGYCFYKSPVNGWVVMLKFVPGYHYIEHHGANWPYLLHGCTAHGMSIDVHWPMLVSSQAALQPWFKSVVAASGKILAGDPGTIIDGDFGTITYQTNK